MSAAQIIISVAAMIVGVVTARSPLAIARIWAPQYLSDTPEDRKRWLLMRYRAFGVLIFMAGALYLVEMIITIYDADRLSRPSAPPKREMPTRFVS